MPDPIACGITPDSRLEDLFVRWPELEAVLLELSPHFGALKNPVLRRTVAKVATLRQVAAVGGVPLGTVIARLRSAAGLAPAEIAEGDSSPPERPPWAVPGAVTRSLDVRAAVEAGEHPVSRVMADLSRTEEGQVYELVTPFVPAPLVELARGKGFVAFSAVESDGSVRTYFRKGPAE